MKTLASIAEGERLDKYCPIAFGKIYFHSLNYQKNGNVRKCMICKSDPALDTNTLSNKMVKHKLGESCGPIKLKQEDQEKLLTAFADRGDRY